MAKVTESIAITGMSCGHCVAAVRSALEDLPGVSVEDVAIGRAQVSYDQGELSHEDISRALREEGYPVVGYDAVQ